MPVFSRRPCAALAPWVQQLWATHPEATQSSAAYRESVLPTGAMHLVLRGSDSPPLMLFDGAAGERSHSIGHLIVGGARSSYYVKQAGDGARSVGVQLQPGGAFALLGVPASELAERHTPLDLLWGAEAARVREQIYDLPRRSFFKACPADIHAWMREQVDLFESFLLQRLRQANTDEPQRLWLAKIIQALERGVPLAAIAESSNISHRTFITRFRSWVGLPPKVFARIRRFQRAITLLNRTSAASYRRAPGSLAQLALETGYADQAHLSRDFVEFAGVSPSAYSKLAPAAPNHVPVQLLSKALNTTGSNSFKNPARVRGRFEPEPRQGDLEEGF
ncbi:MAG TPA: helix-turn-helix domain-containing protein [Polyangiaceae bacterium]|nr:helix-turn-helix domain-containing protein [Polyangiaceae bacterium]